MATNPSLTVLYTTAANRLSKSFSEFPSYVSSNSIVSDVVTGCGDQ